MGGLTDENSFFARRHRPFSPKIEENAAERNPEGGLSFIYALQI